MRDTIRNKIDNILLKHQIVLLIVTLSYVIASFFLEGNVFNIEQRSYHIFDYIVCKALQFILIYSILQFLYNAFISQEKKGKAECHIIKYAIPYFIVIIVFYYFKGVYPYLGDEANIFNTTINYGNCSDWFNFQTGFYYIITMMTLPIAIAPVIFKLVLQSMIVGYIVYRFHNYFQTKSVILVVFFFCTTGCLGLGTEVHRMPIYGIVYAYFLIKLIFDYAQSKSLDNKTLLLLAFIGALLSQWRSEGFYMMVLAPIVILLTYRIKDKKNILKVIVVLFIFQGCMYYPQARDTVAQEENYVTRRMGPFYSYVLTNMCRNGLDREKNKEDLAIVNEYLSLEVVDKLNADFGDEAYNEGYISWYPGYTGVNQYAPMETYLAYVAATKNIIKNNLDIYIKSQLGAWNHVSMRFFPDKHEIKSVSRWYSFATHQLYIPTLVAFIVLIGSFIKRKWLHFFLAGGAISHALICVILLPASYFKYFFVIYLFGYLYLLIGIIKIAKKSKFGYKI